MGAHQHLGANVAKIQLTTLSGAQPLPPTELIICSTHVRTQVALDPSLSLPHTLTSPGAPESYLIAGLDSPLTWLAHFHLATLPYIPHTTGRGILLKWKPDAPPWLQIFQGFP